MIDEPPNDPPRTCERPRTRQPNTYYVHHDPTGSADLTTTIVHALADVMGEDVTGTEFPLYDSVDPDALDRLFAPKTDGTPRPPGHVAFSVQDYRVTVYSSGEIAITPP
ncbi:hypothetical protein HUG10_18865 (plasmid) [Halorarum halophilum]|uniref:Halobacterial output domain-containing protein n=1 Tax=Halorarum halophilum TaxID=2743090 RepID=A0A7D5GKC2_9EURY|nr:HalOD1 output domain-containing protein [Halobaculum halophilum]QLG29671.1 hypothetical protein HUG10_18865 [Halobaculum halophilum]